MRTSHSIYLRTSQNMEEVKEDSVDLVVTSPPYPMISMWDALFSSLNPDIGNVNNSGDGMREFELMHRELDQTWLGVSRILKSGGYLCINIGDATRKVGNHFRLYPSHVRITDFMTRNGFDSLPGIVWHKPSNSPNKFMGSGMLPAGAYVTLEHEHILIFRKKGKREFTGNGDKELRRSSAYFWEERNRWFTDVWNDLRGSRQGLKVKYSRERSAAFPLELPLRLIYMYSVRGDTVLDPFLGTGTTSLAAVLAGRNSVGFESDHTLSEAIRDRMSESVKTSAEHISGRLEAHTKFVEEHRKKGGQFKYFNNNIQCAVKERSEQFITPYVVTSLTPDDDMHFEAGYEQYIPADDGSEEHVSRD